ncbi:MAG: C40 family peptidase [Propionibacteriaceae bacterium]
MRFQRTTASVAAAGLVFGLALTAAPMAAADPTTASDAKTAVEQLRVQASQAEQSYIINAEKAKAAREASAVKQRELDHAATNVANLKSYMGKFALAQYKTRGTDTPALALASGNIANFSTRASTAERVIRSNDEALQAYQAELARQKELKRQIDQDVAAAEAAEQAAKNSESESRSKVTQAETIYNNLSDSEKKAYQERVAQDEATRRTTAQTTPATRAVAAATPTTAPAAEEATSAVPASGRGAAAAAFALSQVGKAYVFGATGMNAYDCSGLTMASWRSTGVGIPRTAGGQLGSGTPVSMSELQPGDVLVYNGGSHAAIYVGNGQVVHALNPSQGIQVLGLYAMGGISGARRYG